MRQGHILYTLYGHEGPANSVNFSPSGDYFTSGGSDAVIMIWKSNLNQFEQELIDDFGGKTMANGAPIDKENKEQPKKSSTKTYKAPSN